MISTDPLRYRLRMNEGELQAATAAGTDAEAQRRLASSLTSAGILVDGRAPGWVVKVLGVLARPALAMTVEILTSGKLVRPVWATPEDAVTGEPLDDGGMELTLLDPLLIPYAITNMVGLRRRIPPPPRPAIRLRASRFAALERQLSTDSDLGTLWEGLRADGVAQDGIDPLLQMIRQRRVSWRVSSVWVNGTGEQHHESLQVTDSGDAGLWLVSVEPAGDADPTFVLETVAASVVWKRLAGLLPGRQPAATETVESGAA